MGRFSHDDHDDSFADRFVLAGLADWRCRRPRCLTGPRRPLRRYRQPAGERHRRPQGRISARNYIYLTHPAAKELSLGCRGQNYSIELYAKGDRKPKPEFFSLVGAAAAIVFTVPKDDTTTGTTRCLKRMGLLRGDKVSHALSPAQPGMHAHQDRSVDRDHARQGRVSTAPAATRAEK